MFSWLVDLVSTINSVPVQPSEDDDLKRKKIEVSFQVDNYIDNALIKINTILVHHRFSDYEVHIVQRHG